MNKLKPQDWLYLKRTVRFGETDGAGVMHFVQLLHWSHEAWEESLDKFGIALSGVFPSAKFNSTNLKTSLPIVYCEAKYFEPLYIGDVVNIELHPHKLNSFSFALGFKFKRNSEDVAISNIRHISIESLSRKRISLSKDVNSWLDKSILNT